MKTNMIWTTLVALLIALTASGCKKDTPAPKPEGEFRQVTLKGFSYICPTILKPVQLADRDQKALLFTLYGDDVTNSIACSVKELEGDDDFTLEDAEEALAELLREFPDATGQAYPDGVLLRKSGVNPQLGKENIYMTMRLMVSGNKLFTLVFNYTESNKVILSKYVDPVINSIQAPK